MIIGCTLDNITWSCDECSKKEDQKACLKFRRVDGVVVHHDNGIVDMDD